MTDPPAYTLVPNQVMPRTLDVMIAGRCVGSIWISDYDPRAWDACDGDGNPVWTAFDGDLFDAVQAVLEKAVTS